MTIAAERFCLNRKVAPSLNIASFFKLVNSLGLQKVELRNDLPGGNITDNLSHPQVRELAERYGIEIISINSISFFNQPGKTFNRLTEQLLSEARDIGAKALVMCPLNNGTPVSLNETVTALRDLADLFASYGISGLVEPLGFQQSSLRSVAQAQHLIRDAGVPFKLLIDTFHQHIYPEADAEFPQIDINQVGLVHLSGVDVAGPRETLSGREHIMLTPADRLQTCQQVKRLESRGYKGIYSFEPFAPELADWDEEKIRQEIENSIRLIQQSS